MKAVAIIEYGISQNQESHVLSNEELADMIEDIIECVKEDAKHNSNVFISKYTRMIAELRNI